MTDFVQADYRQVLLNCLVSDKVRKLNLKDCSHIDPLIELWPFSHLEHLRLEVHDLVDIDKDFDLQNSLADISSHFLPKLKTLKIFHCFGQWSRLFECRRPSLTKVILICSHIGVPHTSLYKWHDVPKLWPNLRELGLRGYSHYTLKALKGIAPFLNEFHHLKKIIVPVELPTGDLEEDHYDKLLPLDVLVQAGHPLPASLCVETDRAIRDTSIGWDYYCPYQPTFLQEIFEEGNIDVIY